MEGYRIRGARLVYRPFYARHANEPQIAPSRFIDGDIIEITDPSIQIIYW